jgi:outer membrane immunogenic protein
MKKFLLASSGALAALIAVAPAEAADIAVRAPAPAYVAPPASDWSGFYVGGHAGYGWGHDPFTDSELPINGGVPGVQVFNIAPTTVTGPHLDGGVFGGQFGYNQQWGNWVGGLEFDISGTGMKGSTGTASSTGTVSTVTTTTTAISTFPFIATTTSTAVIPITNTLSRSDSFDLLASARARVGTLVWGNTLIYGTGGLAWTQFRSPFTQTQNVFGVGGPVPSQSQPRMEPVLERSLAGLPALAGKPRSTIAIGSSESNICTMISAIGAASLVTVSLVVRWVRPFLPLI